MTNLAKLKIGDFVFDPSRNLLVGAGGETVLEPKVADVLSALAAQPGTVLSRDELIDAVWKTEFGADERLTRAISLLRKAFQDERGTAQYIETVPKRGYRLVAAVAEAGDAGIAPAPAPASEPAKPSPRQTWRRWRSVAAAAGIAVVLGAAAVGYDQGWFGPASAKDVVELRPFQVVGGKPGMDAFARQVHASLKRILPSNQVFVIDGAADPAQGGTALRDAEFTLSGLLEQTDGRYAVTLYFNDRHHGQTLWSQRFARSVSEGEGLREEIGANAAYVIHCALEQRAAAAVGPAVEVFKAYLEACNPTYIWAGPYQEPHLLAIARRLTKTAPDDAYGHGLLAIANASSSTAYRLTKAQKDSYRMAARRAAARARELDPRNLLAPLAEVWASSGAESWRLQDEYVKTWGLGHPLAVGGYIFYLRSSGRLDEAVRVLERAVASTPLLPALKTGQAVLMMTVGDHEGADRLFGETLLLWPEFEDAHWFRFVNAAFYRGPDEALKLMRSASKFVGVIREDDACWRTFIKARANGGNVDSGAAVRKACARQLPDYSARMLATLGDADGVYEMMKDRSLNYASTLFLFYPEMARFRRDPRFMSFAVDFGLVEYWRESGNWPDFCSDDDQPYDCKAAAARALQDKPRARTAVAAPSPQPPH